MDSAAGGGGEPGHWGAEGQKRAWGQLAVGDLGMGGLVVGIPRERGASHGGVSRDRGVGPGGHLRGTLGGRDPAGDGPHLIPKGEQQPASWRGGSPSQWSWSTGRVSLLWAPRLFLRWKGMDLAGDLRHRSEPET